MAKSTSQALLELEANASSSSLESKLLICKNGAKHRSESGKKKLPDVKPPISSVPRSEVLGKVRDFIGILSESNKKLQHDFKDNPKDYDIEVLTGNESEHIEMDLILGVADLHTPEAIAAAESAIAGSQPAIPLTASSRESEDSADDSESSSSSESESTSDESDDDSSSTDSADSSDDGEDGSDSDNEDGDNNNSKNMSPEVESGESHPEEADLSNGASELRSRKRLKISRLP